MAEKMKTSNQVVLSIFPGADLLGMAFEELGFCVVRGPEYLLGGDIKNFHIPPHRFNGIIGGPPCQFHSNARKGGNPLDPTQDQPSQFGDMTSEYERAIIEGQPDWWLYENVREAPAPDLQDLMFNEVYDAWAFGASQHRRRRFCSNLPLWIDPLPVDKRHPDPHFCITATENRYGNTPSGRDKRRAGRKLGRRMTILEVAQAMGLLEPPRLDCLTTAMKYKVLGNGVPLEMGRAIAHQIAALIT